MKKNYKYLTLSTLIINQEEKRAQERRRHLVYLIVAFLREQG